MNGWLIFFILVGIWFMIAGGQMLFSKQKAAEIAEKYFGRSGKKPYTDLGKWYDQYYRGGGLFILGLILIIGSIITFFV